MSDSTSATDKELYTPDQDILANAREYDNYEETDIFAWTNNIVQYVDELQLNLYFFNKNNTVYRAKLGGAIERQLRPLFIDEILEFVLGGIEDDYRDWETDRKSTRLNSSHSAKSRMPSSA